MKPAQTKKPVKKRPMGRPGTDAEALMVRIMYEAPKGLQEETLVKFLGISRSVYYDLKRKNQNFSDVIKHYTKYSAIEVLNSFKKIACGYNFEEVTKELKKDKQSGEMKLTITKTTKKHLPPSATAGAFYLKNQMDKEFRDRIEQHNTFGGGLENIQIVIKGR